MNMKTPFPPFFIFTGGPGVGKSTTLQALKTRGYQTYPESARFLIRGANNGLHDAHPKKNLLAFRDRILEKDIEFYKKALLEPQKIAFFDRAIVDILAFDIYRKVPPSKKIEELATKLVYNNKVFFFPPWREIFATDPEREETFEESIIASRHVQNVYLKFGYELLEVPKGSVDFRVDWILNAIK
jgi:predicted ATPase